MIDYQRVVDDIRSVLSSTGVLFDDAIASAAAAYSQACEESNARLRKCGQLLAEGLRSEAIQQCDAEPNLLSVVATLDFPELPDWVAMLRRSGIKSPEPLLVDVAADLNEAYAHEQPLAALLRRHRLLALGHSALRDRIDVLRQLSSLDANNPVWDEDLRDFERSHFQNIGRAVDDECRHGNVAAVAELVRDLQCTEWRESPPKSLVQKVVQSHTRLVRSQARTEMEQLEPQLNDAFSQFDVARGRELRERWNTCAGLCALPTDDPLYDRASPALEWLDEADRAAADEAGYEGAVAALDRALDDEAGIAELERLGHAVLRYERPIPPILDQRLRTRIGGLELARSRRLRLIIASVCLALLLAVAGVSYSVLQNRHAQLVASHVTTLDDLLGKGLHNEATKHLEELSANLPKVASDPQIQALGVKLVGAIREEETRQAKFEEWMQKAETAGPEQPDRAALEQAREIARLDSEKARVLKLESAVADVDRRMQKELDDEFILQLKQLDARLDKLDQVNPDRTLLAKVSHDLAELTKYPDQISPAVHQQSSVTRERIKRMYAAIARRDQSIAAFQSISNGVGRPDDFKRALETFAEEFSESAQAADFRRAASEIDLWKTALAWNDFIIEWQKHPVDKLSPAAAKERIAACENILNDHPGHPAADAVQRRLPQLEAIARRNVEGEGRLEAPLNELFTDPLIAALWMVEVTDSEGALVRYYCIDEPPKPRDNQALIRIQYIVDFSRAAKQGKEIAVKYITFSGLSPQSVLAKSALDKLANLGDSSWERTFYQIVSGIESDEHLEPILKVILLQKVLEVGCHGSDILDRSFRRFNKVLGTIAIDPAVPWMNPQDQDAIRVRKLAMDLLGRLPSLHDIGATAAAELTAFRAPLGPSHIWIGWLARDDDGKWQCMSAVQEQPDGELWTAQPSIPRDSFTWAKIGRVEGGIASLNITATAAFVQGRPVFLVTGARE